MLFHIIPFTKRGPHVTASHANPAAGKIITMVELLTERIERGLACCPVILMPFLKQDIVREQQLHQIASALKLEAKTIKSTNRCDRYHCVMITKVEQLGLI